MLDGGGAIKVEVDPVLPTDLSMPLIENMVESLWEENVPASTAAGFTPRYNLRAELEIINRSVLEAEKAKLIWTLTEVNSKKIHKFNYKLSGSHPGWLLLDKNLLNNLPANMAKDVVSHLYKRQGLETSAPNLRLESRLPVLADHLIIPKTLKVKTLRNANDSVILSKIPKICLVNIVGAPSEEHSRLDKNMRRMLIIAGVSMVEDRRHSDFLLNGFVNISPAFGASNNIAITWLVTTKDGLVVGKTTQNRTISNRTIMRQWRQAAAEMVVGASSNIMSIIASYLESSRD